MYVRKNIGSKGRIYLTIVHGYRDINGVPRQKLIENLGYLDELENRHTYNSATVFFDFKICIIDSLKSILQTLRDNASLILKPQL